MMGISYWVSHLDNPLTVIAFVFFITALILKLTHPARLPEKLLSNIIYLLFTLAFVIIIGSFWLAFSQAQTKPVFEEKNLSATYSSNQKQQDKNEPIHQESHGGKSPNIYAPNGDVNIKY